MKRRKRWIIGWTLILGLATTMKSVAGLDCFECGIMYDGNAFMGLKDVEQCQFLESDAVRGDKEFMKTCPEDDTCCFSLREHMTIDFWGHSAAAEVFVHGCCSSLNKTSAMNHLHSSKTPPLAKSKVFKAEILSKTYHTGHVKSRIMFCNSNGCNYKRVPWSVSTIHEQEEEEKGDEESESIHDVQDSIETEAEVNEIDQRLERLERRRTGPIGLETEPVEDLNVIDLLHIEDPNFPLRHRGKTRPVNREDLPDLDSETVRRKIGPRLTAGRPRGPTAPGGAIDVLEEFRTGISNRLIKEEDEFTSRFRSPVCECHCNCPTLSCSGVSGAASRASPMSLWMAWLLSLVCLRIW